MTEKRTVAMVWAQACAARDGVDALRVQGWPQGLMTERERLQVREVDACLDEAARAVRKLQSLLAERSKLAGLDHPDMLGYRALGEAGR